MNPKEIDKLKQAGLFEVQLAKRELGGLLDDDLIKDEKKVADAAAGIIAFLKKAQTTVEPTNNPTAITEVEQAVEALMKTFLQRLSVVLDEAKQAIALDSSLNADDKAKKTAELGVIFDKHLAAVKTIIRGFDSNMIGAIDFSVLQQKIDILKPDESQIALKEFETAMGDIETKATAKTVPWDTVATEWNILLEAFQKNVVRFLQAQSGSSVLRYRQLGEAETLVDKAKDTTQVVFDSNPEYLAFVTAQSTLETKIPGGYAFDGSVDLSLELAAFKAAKINLKNKVFSSLFATRRDTAIQEQEKLESDSEFSEWCRLAETTYPELKELADLTASHATAATFVDPEKALEDYKEKIAAVNKLDAKLGTQPERQRFVVNTYISPTEAVLKKLQTLVDKKYVDDGPKRIAEQERQRTKDNIYRFLRDIRVPQDAVERRPGEPIRDYLERLHPYIIARVAALLWNKRYDNADSGERTHDYKNSPLLGPAEELSINGKVLSYDQTDSQNVKTLESLFDLFRDFFDDPADHKEAAAFANRMKNVFAEMSVFHNRAVVRRHNDGKEGPDPAYEGIKKIFNAQGSYAPDIERLFNRTEMTDQEKRFSEATEFCMAVWSFENLKMGERLKLWPYASARVKEFFTPDTDPDGNPIIVFKYDGQVPAANGSSDKQIELIEKMIDKAKEMLDPSLPPQVQEMIASMAYHIGESYRIGFGMEAFMDVKYFTKKSKLTGKPAVSVGAKMGEPKAASVGLYADSTNTNESRQDFNLAFEEYMVHGYLPLCRAVQYTHNIKDGGGRPLDIAELGDMRASLAEILAVEGGVASIDWNSRSSNPDKTIMDQATEALSMWQSSALERSAEKAALLWKSEAIPLGVTQALNNDHEVLTLNQEFSTGDKLTAWSARLKTGLAAKFGGANAEFLEKYGFSSPNENVTTTEKQRLAGLIKHFRDYWLGGIMSDSKRYPLDILRYTRYLFQRNDRPENNYFVSSQMKKIFDFGAETSSLPAGDPQKKRMEDFSNRLAGYMWYDVTLRATIYQHAPNIRYRREADMYRTDHGRRELYEQLNDTTWKQFDVTNMVGKPALNLAQLAWVINEACNIRDLLPEEKQKFFESGYRIDEHRPEDEVDCQTLGAPFTRKALLRMAQRYGLGEGYEYRLEKDPEKKLFWQLKKIDEHKITLQDVMNRLLMMRFLFSKDLNIRKK